MNITTTCGCGHVFPSPLFCVPKCPECGNLVIIEPDSRFDATMVQPTPKGSGTPIVDLVKIDLDRRAFVGEQKYGEKLKAFNGRDALMDAYQEALDLVCYLRQAIEERDYDSH